jgi:hypothetical protein
LTVLNVHDDLKEIFAAVGLAQTFTYILAIEHAGDLAQQFEVRIGCRLRHQKYEQQIDRHAVDGVEVDCRLQVQTALIGALQPARRQWGMAMPLPKPVEPASRGDEAFEDVLGIQVGQIACNQIGDLFEHTFFAAARHVHQGTAGGQDIFKSDHG